MFVVTKYLTIKDYNNHSSSLTTDAEELNIIFDGLNQELAEFDMSLKLHAISINLYITDMSSFSEINSVYRTYFGLKPPVRICVAIPKISSAESKVKV